MIVSSNRMISTSWLEAKSSIELIGGIIFGAVSVEMTFPEKLLTRTVATNSQIPMSSWSEKREPNSVPPIRKRID